MRDKERGEETKKERQRARERGRETKAERKGY